MQTALDHPRRLAVRSPAASRFGRRLMFPIANVIRLRYPPIATWTLVAANCVIFLYEVSLSQSQLAQFFAQFALIPARYFDPAFANSARSSLLAYVPFVSNMFLHASWFHLIVNMWTLWLFGSVVEDQLGSGRYLLFYFACGVAASLAHAYFNPISAVPALGASGAIAGVLGCYLWFFPFSRILVIVPILFLPLFFEVPALVFIGLWFLIQLLGAATGALTAAGGGGFAWWAHVGGFLAGIALAGLMRTSRRTQWPRDPDIGIPGFALSRHV
jgi:membrane associated rhomboid family serine protease